MNMREEFEAAAKECGDEEKFAKNMQLSLACYAYFIHGANAALAAQAKQNHIADTSKMVQAVNAIASQTGESAESIIEWLTDQGGLTQLMLSHFGGIAAQAQQPSADEWSNAQAIADMSLVEEALRGFSEDPTGDNGTMVVREVMRAVAAQAPFEQELAEANAKIRTMQTLCFDIFEKSLMTNTPEGGE